MANNKATLRVGHLMYLNAIPFYQTCSRWRDGRIKLVGGVPSQIGDLAASGQLDAAPLSILDYFKLEADFELLPYGIAAYRQAQSVLLFSHVPVDELAGEVIGITEDTSTSVCLLRLVLEEYLGVRPAAYVKGTVGRNAWLLIGDTALKERRQYADLRIQDLGQLWWSWKHVPFVFAQWAVRRTLPDADKAYLNHLLDESLMLAEDFYATITPHYAEYMSVGADELVSYWRGFTYRIGSQENRGREVFRCLLEARAVVERI